MIQFWGIRRSKMVQRIKNKTVYRCRLCKKIYTSMKRALECEDTCLDERDNFEWKPVEAILKMEGKKHKVILNYKVRKFKFWLPETSHKDDKMNQKEVLK